MEAVFIVKSRLIRTFKGVRTVVIKYQHLTRAMIIRASMSRCGNFRTKSEDRLDNNKSYRQTNCQSISLKRFTWECDI